MSEATSEAAATNAAVAGAVTPAEGAEGGVPRRQALCSILALGILGPAALAACSNDTQYGTPAAGTPGAPLPTDTAPPTATLPDGTAPANPAPAGGGAALAQASQIQVGSGVIATAPDGRQIVITRSAPTKISAYNASCTHAGTTVGAPVQGVMTCPNHGSKFDAKNGSVISGPAPSPLQGVAIKLDGDNIVLA